MIVLELQQETAGTVYFDIHHLEVGKEEKRPSCLVAGILGDGWYEGEVSIKFGQEVEVTFADQWLARQSLQEFFSRVDREVVCSALADVLDEAVAGLASNREPHVALRHMGVSSGEPSWRAA